MRKSLIVLIIPLLLFLCVAGCDALDSGLQVGDISLLSVSTGPDIFQNTVSDYTPANSSEEPPEPASSIDFSFMGKNIRLYYNASLSTDLNVYMTKDSTVTCWCDKYTNALRLISSENWDNFDYSEMEQPEFESWIQNQVNAYYPEQWEQYQLTVKTALLSQDGDSGESTVEPQFIYWNDTVRSIDSYAFTYTRYISGFATTDLIHACFWPTQSFAVIEFSAHNFDDITAVDITPEKIQATVDQFIPGAIDTQKYAYRSHSITNMVLTCQQEQLYCTCTVSIVTLSATEASDPLTTTVELILPLQ